MKEILGYITNYDFPQKDIILIDLFAILRELNICRGLIDRMATNQENQDSDAILELEASGFIFWKAIASHRGNQ